MPSIATVVADLQNGSINSIGQIPRNDQTTMDKEISLTTRVMYFFCHINASIAGTKLHCTAAASGPSFNGSYLHYKDDWSTVANMDVNRPLVVSGNFSGCMWKVFRSDQQGLFKCIHIYRGGTGSDTLVNLVTGGHAVTQKWTEIQALPTAGRIVGAVKGVVVVSQLFSNRIDTALLDLDNTNTVVNVVFQSDRI
jgi:hypothetical protein